MALIGKPCPTLSAFHVPLPQNLAAIAAVAGRRHLDRAPPPAGAAAASPLSPSPPAPPSALQAG